MTKTDFSNYLTRSQLWPPLMAPPGYPWRLPQKRNDINRLHGVLTIVKVRPPKLSMIPQGYTWLPLGGYPWRLIYNVSFWRLYRGVHVGKCRITFQGKSFELLYSKSRGSKGSNTIQVYEIIGGRLLPLRLPLRLPLATPEQRGRRRWQTVREYLTQNYTSIHVGECATMKGSVSVDGLWIAYRLQASQEAAGAQVAAAGAGTLSRWQTAGRRQLRTGGEG